jgi:hypothetical protein
MFSNFETKLRVHAGYIMVLHNSALQLAVWGALVLLTHMLFLFYDGNCQIDRSRAYL